NIFMRIFRSLVKPLLVFQLVQKWGLNLKKKKGVEPTIEAVGNDGNPLVPTGIMESDSEVELVFDESANLRIPTSGKDKSDKG
ncbi:hypothetical protein Tco_0830594, partial [Tanacetum coccineum]